jgi:hypothetical protein
MNTKWENGIEEGRTTEIEERINASDGGGDGTKIERTTTTKASIQKENEKPQNLDLVA